MAVAGPEWRRRDPGRTTLPTAEERGEAAVPARIESSALFRGRREVVILHQGHEYRLRITRANKLILTK